MNDTVSFQRHACSKGGSDAALRRAFLRTPNTQTLAEVNLRDESPENMALLLLGFFVHYAELRMDQAVSVATASIVPRPGSGWTFERFCILDPLAADEDLGRHLTPETLPVLRRELARARLELASGKALTAVMNGNKCHGRNTPDDGDAPTAARAGQQQANAAPTSSAVCNFFLAGKCKKGDKCRFLHAVVETVPATTAPSEAAAIVDRVPQQKRQLQTVQSTPADRV